MTRPELKLKGDVLDIKFAIKEGVKVLTNVIYLAQFQIFIKFNMGLKVDLVVRLSTWLSVTYLF